MAELWDILPSTAVPGQLHLILRQPVNRASAALRNPVIGISYSDIELPNKPLLQEQLNGVDVADYILTRVGKDVENHLTFRFAPLAPVAGSTPSPFQSFEDWEPYGWPMVLGRPDFWIDEGNPRVGEDSTGALYLPRGYVRYKYRNAMHCHTRITVQQYASHQKWSRNYMLCTEPKPEPVEWWWYGDDQSFPACLHPEIEVPPQTRSNKRAGGADANTSLRIGRIFPATNVEDRSRWELNTQQEVEAEGIWIRTRKIYHPPPSQEQEIR